MASQPLASGHRLVLRYKLEYLRPGTADSAAFMRQEIEELSSMLQNWNKHKCEEGEITNLMYGDYKYLAYILGHKYPGT